MVLPFFAQGINCQNGLSPHTSYTTFHRLHNVKTCHSTFMVCAIYNLFRERQTFLLPSNPFYKPTMFPFVVKGLLEPTQPPEVKSGVHPG